MVRSLVVKRYFFVVTVLVLGILGTSSWVISQEEDSRYLEALKNNESVLLDALPSEVIATIETRDRGLAELQAAAGAGGFDFFVDNFRKWVPGQTVRVAFLGGDTDLHRAIEEATKQITDAANIKLDFGCDCSCDCGSGEQSYRTWSTTDTEYKAEIRVSFDQIGYFSLVGTDSVSPNIGSSFGAVGGRPYQRTLNLQGFHLHRPANFKRLVRHEFMHALGVLHEHQIPGSVCMDQFRWNDDFGYDKSSKVNGEFVPDASGKRPGIFTYLSGAPNFWPDWKVRANLFPQNLPNASFEGIDRSSIMLYRFKDFFYHQLPNACAPEGSGENLSEGDKKGLRTLYPFDQANLDLRRNELEGQFTNISEALESAENAPAVEEFRGVLQMHLEVLSEEEPASDSEEEPASDSEEEPAPDSEEEPASDSEEEPAPDSEEEPAPDSEEEPAPDSEEEPAPDSEEEPAPDSEEEPVPDSEEEPAPDSEEEPVPDSEEEPAPDSEEEPAPDSE